MQLSAHARDRAMRVKDYGLAHRDVLRDLESLDPRRQDSEKYYVVLSDKEVERNRRLVAVCAGNVVVTITPLNVKRLTQ